MQHPRTPSKADDEIESLKTSLTAKWGIKFSARDFLLSPSRRDLNCTEDRILACMQFLYWKEGALNYAINQFENDASTIFSQWQFKPRAEADVLPTREAQRSALRQDFLHRRIELGQAAAKELAESLWNTLSQVAERVKKGEKFPKQSVEKPKAASIVRVARTEAPRRQASITQWFRSKSEPKATPTSQQLSSVDFQDADMTDVFEKVACSPIATTCGAPDIRPRGTSVPVSPTNDNFETPPSTPPRNKGVGSGSGLSESFYHKKPEIIPIISRKRSFPEPMRPLMSRKVSRDTRNHGNAYNINHLQPANKSSDQALKSYSMPTPSPRNTASFPSSLSTNRSSENLASISTSFTSISTAWTSPNTSFHSDSMATSFRSNTAGTDTTERASFNMARNSTFNGKLALQSEANASAWDNVNKVQNLKIGKDAFDLLDIDSEPTIVSRTLIKPKLESKNFLDGPEIRTAESGLDSLLAERLRSFSPFSIPLPEQYSAVPLRVLYEIIRVSIDCRLDLGQFSTCLNITHDSYDKLWSSLSTIVELHGRPMPERLSRTAWDRAGKDFQGVALTGKLNILDQQKGPVFDFVLNPLKVERSYRLSRQFGSDRFCLLGMPGLDRDSLPTYLKSSVDPAREAIIKWLVEAEHHFLGRTWRAFYTKPDVSKRGLKALKNKADKTRYRVYFFAQDGPGFRQAPRSGEADPRILDRPFMRVEDLIEWFMPAKLNEGQPCLKFFARLALGVSSTTPSIVFEPDEIFRADDARADFPCRRELNQKRSDEKKTQTKPSNSKAPVMNDGCARISQNAARGIADSLGLDSIPCVFQGRIGGAKGIWMIDPIDENPPALNNRNYWIEITDSQLKFEDHAQYARSPQRARVTFEVNGYAKKLTPSTLNFQLLPILENRKVPARVFISLVEKDLTARVAELEVAMDSGLALRKWNQTINPVTEERAQYGAIEMQGGLPQSKAEKINWFVEHGFEPKTCRYLKDLLYQVISSYCLRLISKMHIGLAESTYAFMIADPLAILEENEVHIAFSSAFRDHKTGIDQTMLHDIEVLVARSPAHLPSDIQKVRAIFKPELRLYRDVIVFPSKGSVSLASKLSGGDYDGDKAWVCWDPDIVEPFQNADVPNPPKMEFYGIEKHSTKVSDILTYQDYTNRFLRQAFNFNLQTTMLGICTLYHEAYCYHEKGIDSKPAIQIATLLGNLVDSAKGGYIFDKAKWTNFLKTQKLPRTLPKPAYKDRNKARPTKHLIDHLVFVTARSTREDVLKKFSEHFQGVPDRDDDLFQLRVDAVEEAKANKELGKVLDNLEAGLRTIREFWRLNVRVEDDEAVQFTRQSNAQKSNALTFPTLVERCRKDFLNLAPTLDTAPTSDKIATWQCRHAADLSSHWDLLKASVAFYHYYKSTFIWHVAGVELGEIKATARGRGSYRPVVGEVFERFKLDSRAADGALRREMLEREYGDKNEDDDDEFGDFDIDVDDL